MSKVVSTETLFTDIDCVRQALEMQGFTPTYNEGYTEITMQGYNKSFKANLGLSKANYTKVTGNHAYGDMGFTANANGPLGFTFDDLNINQPNFVAVFDGIKSAYAEKWHDQTMYESGFVQASRTVDANGVVDLQYAKMMV